MKRYPLEDEGLFHACNLIGEDAVRVRKPCHTAPVYIAASRRTLAKESQSTCLPEGKSGGYEIALVGANSRRWRAGILPKETLNKEPIRAGEPRKFRDCLFLEQLISQFYDFRPQIRAFQGFFTPFSALRTQFARRAPSAAS